MSLSNTLARLVRSAKPMTLSSRPTAFAAASSRMSSKKGWLLLAGVVAAMGSSLLAAQTTVLTNVNGYTMNSERELVQFTGIQFTGDTVDRLLMAGDARPD